MAIDLKIWLLQGFHFAWAMLGGNLPAQIGLVVMAIPLVITGAAAYFLSCSFLPQRNVTTRYWRGLIDGAKALGKTNGGCPHLLFFSADDKLIPVQRVRAFADELKAANVSATSVEWARSEHVAHLRHHTEEYIEKLGAFLR